MVNHIHIHVHVAGEMLSVAEPFLEQQMHPTTIITAYRQALDDIISITRDKIRYVAISICLSGDHPYIYSGTSELQTPRDLLKVSIMGRCPLYSECTQ